VHFFEAKQNTYSSIFAKSRNERFFISFKSKPNPFIGIENDITNIYSNWTETRALPIKPGFDFDGLVFIRNTTNSVTLD
jgi:hypothetical protein